MSRDRRPTAIAVLSYREHVPAIQDSGVRPRFEPYTGDERAPIP